MIDPLRPAAFAMLGAAALLAGCNQAPEDAAPTPALTTSAPRTADVAGAPLTAGSWLVEETGTGASAVFADPAGAPVIRLVCRRADRAVILTRSGVAEATTFRLQAGAHTANLAMVPAATSIGDVEAVVDPAQPIFAVFADPAATIRMEAPGTPALHLPSHTGIGRVAQACS